MSEPWQERVIAERRDLASKLHRLGGFIDGNASYFELPVEERVRLQYQRVLMTAYLAVLEDRIAHFQ